MAVFDNNNATTWKTPYNSYYSGGIGTNSYKDEFDEFAFPFHSYTYTSALFPIYYTTISSPSPSVIVNGEWIQIKFQKRTCVIDIYATAPNADRGIRGWYLVGTNDTPPNNWNAIYSNFTVQTIGTNTETSILPATSIIKNTISYLYYRLIITRIKGNNDYNTLSYLELSSLKFIINESIIYSDSILCIGEPINSTPSVNTLLDVNGGANFNGTLTSRNTVSEKINVTKSSWTAPLLSLDAGIQAYGYNTFDIGKPLLRIGRESLHSSYAGEYYGIGFGYAPLAESKQCCEIGIIVTNNTGNESGDLVFSTRIGTSDVAATERMRIYGFTSSTVGGDSGAGTQSFFAAGSFNPAVAVTAGASTKDVAVMITKSLWVKSTIVASSDSRIKEDIQDINDNSALNMILAIEPKTYKYIDKINKGYNTVYGFIAQQIREIIPEATSINKSYIPNIMLLAVYNDSIVTLPLQPTNIIIKQNDKIKCYDINNTEINVKVVEVIDELSFRINEIKYTDNKIFVYGTEIDDFHTLDKTYIFTLNVCATQELHRRIEAQDVIIKAQDERIKKLEQILGV